MMSEPCGADAPEHRASAAVEDRLWGRTATLLGQAGLAAYPTIVAVVSVFWTKADQGGLLLWAFAAALGNTIQTVGARRMAAGDGRGASRRALVVGQIVSSTGWGSISLLALPEDPRWQALLVVFVYGLLASATIYSGAVRPLFYSGVLVLSTMSVIGFASAGSFGQLLAGVVVYGALVSIHLQSVGHADTVRAAVDAHERSVLAEELVGERERLVEVNEELAAANASLADQATHDTLTGLANRSLFTQHLTTAMARARREGSTIAVLFFDLDRFKVVNDSLGHAAGDALLREVGERVRPLLREGDALSRLGGDEFTVLLTNLADAEEAIAVAERVSSSFTAPFVLEGREVKMTASVGVSLDRDHLDEPDDLLRHADAALYRAKAAGRNQVAVFDAGLRDELQRRLDDEIEIRAALSAGEFSARFQPVIDPTSGRIVGAEALARWARPDGELRPASEFLPLAEEAGLGAELDGVVRREAFAFRARVAGLVDDDFVVHVNVSPSELDAEAMEVLLGAIGDAGCPPHGVVIEVTETAVASDVDRVVDVLREVRSRGVGVYLDDFGTGYSSLSLFARLPLDGLKLDRGLLLGGLRPGAGRAVVAATVDLATALGLPVVAEGVEQQDQAELVAALGCERAQGWLWASAVDGETFATWLRTGAPWRATPPANGMAERGSGGQ